MTLEFGLVTERLLNSWGRIVIICHVLFSSLFSKTKRHQRESSERTAK